MFSLEVHDLTKRVDKTTVITTPHLSLSPGEFLALLGPPGSGKTMLLRLLSGLENADRGKILLNGKDVTNLPASQRNISLLFQHGYGLIPHMTVSECIALPLQHMQMSKDGMAYRVATLAKTLNIAHLLDRKISTLKPGERLRVALARASAKNPSIYFFDSPLEHLDTPTRLLMRREILEIQQKMGFPCIYTTNDVEDAFAFTNRVAVINDGKIQQIGSRSDLVQKPATRWVAQWLSFPPMNTIKGYLQGSYQAGGVCYRLWAKGFTPLLPGKWTRIIDIHQCKEIYVGIRPEHIIPEWEFQQRWRPSFYTLRGEVQASEWNQGKTLVQFSLPNVDESFMATFDIPHDQVKIGQAFSVAFDPESFCLFHPQTQQLLQIPDANSNWHARANSPTTRPLARLLGRPRRETSGVWEP